MIQCLLQTYPTFLTPFNSHPFSCVSQNFPVFRFLWLQPYFLFPPCCCFAACGHPEGEVHYVSAGEEDLRPYTVLVSLRISTVYGIERSVTEIITSGIKSCRSHTFYTKQQTRILWLNCLAKRWWFMEGYIAFHLHRVIS